MVTSFYQVQAGDTLPVGSVLAALSTSPNFSLKNLERDVRSDSAADVQIENYRPSGKARALIRELNLDESVFYGSGLVTESDVRDYLREREADHDSSRLQSLNITDRSVALLGGGGYARTCIDVVRQMGGLEILGILDAKMAGETFGVPVIGRDDDLDALRKAGLHLVINAVGAVSNHASREKIFQMILEKGFKVPSLIHPKAIVEPSAHNKTRGAYI